MLSDNCSQDMQTEVMCFTCTYHVSVNASTSPKSAFDNAQAGFHEFWTLKNTQLHFGTKLWPEA